MKRHKIKVTAEKRKQTDCEQKVGVVFIEPDLIHHHHFAFLRLMLSALAVYKQNDGTLLFQQFLLKYIRFLGTSFLLEMVDWER